MATNIGGRKASGIKTLLHTPLTSTKQNYSVSSSLKGLLPRFTYQVWSPTSEDGRCEQRSQRRGKEVLVQDKSEVMQNNSLSTDFHVFQSVIARETIYYRRLIRKLMKDGKENTPAEVTRLARRLDKEVDKSIDGPPDMWGEVLPTPIRSSGENGVTSQESKACGQQNDRNPGVSNDWADSGLSYDCVTAFTNLMTPISSWTRLDGFVNEPILSLICLRIWTLVKLNPGSTAAQVWANLPILDLCEVCHLLISLTLDGWFTTMLLPKEELRLQPLRHITHPNNTPHILVNPSIAKGPTKESMIFTPSSQDGSSQPVVKGTLFLPDLSPVETLGLVGPEQDELTSFVRVYFPQNILTLGDH
eukprot:GHVN01083324.1.p1 GENE.GHVN01083324.1~~GHVN01083324.1.p1  ORF type:complete len:371 (-),score=62.59 GHVN01083324.1:959-2038(-)